MAQQQMNCIGIGNRVLFLYEINIYRKAAFIIGHPN